MLYLTRKIGESIVINNNIELTVMDVRGKTVKLGFLFPKEASILRKELHQKILEENLAAASGDGMDLLEVEFTLGDETPNNDEDDNRGNR
ncbi:MAG: carbon storage regulator [Alphaproteobacteria bacterium]|nr:carbon storage regulator [Alphaproteobacteria bacterium]